MYAAKHTRGSLRLKAQKFWADLRQVRGEKGSCDNSRTRQQWDAINNLSRQRMLSGLKNALRTIMCRLPFFKSQYSRRESETRSRQTCYPHPQRRHQRDGCSRLGCSNASDADATTYMSLNSAGIYSIGAIFHKLDINDNDRITRESDFSDKPDTVLLVAIWTTGTEGICSDEYQHSNLHY